MERLTFKGNFCDICLCTEDPCVSPETWCSQKQVWERLKQYEDTGLTPEQVKKMRWISVEEGLPTEHDSIFAKFKGTEKWNSSMWEKGSDNCNVVIKFEDGSRMVTSCCTHDGKWFTSSISYIHKGKVTHWMPKPELPQKEDGK